MFRIAVREYFEYLEALKGVGKEYTDCPFECRNAVKKFDIAREAYCEKCPKRYQKAKFETQFKESIKAMLGKDYTSKHKFSDIEAVIYSVAGKEELSRDKISIFTGTLLNIYLSERADSRS